MYDTRDVAHERYCASGCETALLRLLLVLESVTRIACLCALALVSVDARPEAWRDLLVRPSRAESLVAHGSLRRDEGNLTHNEESKSAKMKIDEPETPWASPPKELFDDDGAQRTHSARHAPALSPLAELFSAGGGADLSRVAARLGEAQTAGAGSASGWESGDDTGLVGVDAQAAGQQEARQASPVPDADADAELRRRLFEARRKALQGNYQGVAARQPSSQDAKEEEEEEGEQPQPQQRE